jgi:hypothetical protein
MSTTRWESRPATTLQEGDRVRAARDDDEAWTVSQVHNDAASPHIVRVDFSAPDGHVRPFTCFNTDTMSVAVGTQEDPPSTLVSRYLVLHELATALAVSGQGESRDMAVEALRRIGDLAEAAAS